MSLVVSKQQPLKHYAWGGNCDAWNLVDEEAFSIKQERMPAGSSEEKHYHKKAQQFFYIIKGHSTFEIEGTCTNVAAREGIRIEAGKKHRVVNNTSGDVEFILCSQPSTINDRFNCP
jgi:mannose-6-phosphate isomerase-like protein (cupin superfamily)